MQACGQIVNAMEKLIFVDVSSTLWSPTMGNPRILSSATGANPPTSTATFTGKLEGEYIWDFTLDLPKEVVMPCGFHNKPRVFTLPQSFHERQTKVSIAYEVVVRVVRGKLRADHRYVQWR